MNLQHVAITKLRGNPKNPRIIKDEKFQKLVQSIRDFPEMLALRPIVVDADYMVLGGNMRLKACQAAGLKEVPIVVASDLTPDQQREFVIKDNVGFGEWEWDALANEWDAAELTQWGLDLPNFEAEPTAGQTDPDEVPEAPAEPVIKPGDLIALGEHRLLCGDSTDVLSVERLMGADTAEFVFTDPPYGMKLQANYHRADWGNRPNTHSRGNQGNAHRNVMGDHDDFSPDLILTVFACFPDCDEVFLWGADYYAEYLPGKNDGSWIVWDKVTNASGEESGCAAFHGSNFELCWSKAKHKRELARIMHKGLASVENDRRVHPTQKPVALAEWFFERWAKNRQIVVDLYGGSGSTLIACEKSGRFCRMMELDPRYCDVIVKRWQDFTGRTATYADTGQPVALT